MLNSVFKVEHRSILMFTSFFFQPQDTQPDVYETNDLPEDDQQNVLVSDTVIWPKFTKMVYFKSVV